MHTKVKNYSRLRIGWQVGMMDKIMLNWAAVVTGTECCKGIFTYIYGDCKGGQSIMGIGF